MSCIACGERPNSCCDMPREIYIGLVVLVAMAIAATIIAKHNTNQLLATTGSVSSTVEGILFLGCIVLGFGALCTSAEEEDRRFH